MYLLIKMASFLTESEKTSLNNVMDDIHDTFLRTIKVYRDPSKVIITPNNSYNSIYGNAGSVSSVVNTPQYTEMNATIQYANNYNDQFFADDESDPPQLKIKIPQGRVRIKIKAVDLDVAKNGKRFVFDGNTFTIDSDFLAHGLFGVRFYTFFVKEIS